MKYHEALAGALADYEVTTMFGVIGDGNMFLVDSFVKNQNGRYVAAANEAGAVLMATGFASGSRSVGVASVTHGPGLGNTIGSLVSATREQAAVLLIAGDTTVRGHTQNIDQAALIAPTGAGFEQASSAQSVGADLRRALRRVVAERRPIILNVPVGLTFQDVDYRGGVPKPVGVLQAVQPDDEAMDVAVGLIASARRPIVLAGIGAISPSAPDALRRLAATLGAPLMTTLPAKGLFGYEKYDMGVFGSFSTPEAVDAITESDCIVAVGASLTRLTGGGDGHPFFQGKRIVHCDIDQRAVDAQYPADAPVIADAATFANSVVEWLEQAGYTATSFRERLAQGGSDAGESRTAAGDTTDHVDLALALDALNAALPAGRAITVDGGRYVPAAVQRLTVPRAQSWSHSGRGFGAVGNGVSVAIGIGCARPDEPVVAVVGDGAFMLGGLAEFNTAVRHDVDLIVAIFNDGSYGAEYKKLKERDFGIDMSLFAWPEFEPLALALGGAGYTVRCHEDLAALREVIANRDRPLIIDFKLNPAKIAY
jgi:acetolactate synthase-1/2/3 large subunit